MHMYKYLCCGAIVLQINTNTAETKINADMAVSCALGSGHDSALSIWEINRFENNANRTSSQVRAIICHFQSAAYAVAQVLYADRCMPRSPISLFRARAKPSWAFPYQSVSIVAKI